MELRLFTHEARADESRARIERLEDAAAESTSTQVRRGGHWKESAKESLPAVEEPFPPSPPSACPCLPPPNRRAPHIVPYRRLCLLSRSTDTPCRPRWRTWPGGGGQVMALGCNDGLG